MRGLKTQRGISGWGVMGLLIILGFAALIGLKLVPIYLESFKIDKALAGLMGDETVTSQSKARIAQALVKRLDIDDVRRIHDKNYKQFVTIKKVKGKVTMRIKYRAEEKLFGNVSLVVDFDKYGES